MDFASPRSNYSSVSQLNVSRLMKLHDPAAQILPLGNNGVTFQLGVILITTGSPAANLTVLFK